MGATAGITFNGTTLGYGTVAGTYTTAFEITDIGGLGSTAAPIDMSHSTSPNNQREYLPGMADGKDFSVTVNYSRADAAIIETIFNTVKYWDVTLPNGDEFEFTGILNDFEHAGATGDKLTSNISIKITSKVDHTAGA